MKVIIEITQPIHSPAWMDNDNLNYSASLSSHSQSLSISQSQQVSIQMRTNSISIDSQDSVAMSTISSSSRGKYSSAVKNGDVTFVIPGMKPIHKYTQCIILHNKIVHICMHIYRNEICLI